MQWALRAAVVRLAFQLPAGVLTDRLSRRRLMLTADAVRFLVYGWLSFTVLTGRATLWWIIATVVIEATRFAVVHDNAQLGAVRNVVPLSQVAATRLLATKPVARDLALVEAYPVGGALFAVARGLPLAANVVLPSCPSSAFCWSEGRCNRNAAMNRRIRWRI